MKKHDDIDKLFRDTFENHEEAPQTDLWEKISKQLDDKRQIISLSSVKKKRTNWLKYAAAAGLVISLGIGYIAMQDNVDNKHANISERNTVPLPNKAEYVAVASEETEKTQEKVAEKQNIEILNTNTETSKPHFASDERPKPFSSSMDTNLQKNASNSWIEETDIVKEIKYAEVTPELDATTALVSVDLEPAKEPVFISVTEADPIRPMIEPFEEEENMVAGTFRKTTNTLVSGFLNIVGENISHISNKDVTVSKDDEGSLKIDFGGLLARSKNKKRR